MYKIKRTFTLYLRFGLIFVVFFVYLNIFPRLDCSCILLAIWPKFSKDCPNCSGEGGTWG